MSRVISLILFVLMLAVQPAIAAPKPAFIYESLLQSYFDDESGMLSFKDFDLAFAPPAPLNASVVVTDSKGTVIKSFEFFPDYRWVEGVFANAMVKGPADVQLSEPGIYNIVLIVDGELATRIPFVLEQTGEGNDPFDPVKTYRFHGVWQVYGYLTMREWKDEVHPKLTFWVGGKDLAENTEKDMFVATLKRDGEVIGHSRRTLGFIAPGAYSRVDIDIYEPHEPGKEVNTKFIMQDEWTKDGEYEIIVTRNKDNAMIRRFSFTSADGKIGPIANSQLGFEPRVDYIVPRVRDRRSQNIKYEEAIWIKSGPKASQEP